MRKSVVRITCFILVLSVVLLYVNRVFKVKYWDGPYNVTQFYDLENNAVDVLILGSSHAFEDFNTGILWNEYGIAAYLLGGSNQPMWNTYYYLKEALKTQTPELVVLEGYNVTLCEEFLDDSRIIMNTYGLKWSLDRLNAIKISAPKERWAEFILGYTQYHTRYSELSKADFYKKQGDPLYEDWQGFLCNMRTMPSETVDVTSVDARSALYEKSEEYYRKTIELAQANNIPIIVIITPYAEINENTQSMYNTAMDIASEYGVCFINCNLLLDEIGIDYSLDAADTQHLNFRGNQKFSHYIGAVLKDNFEISNRRQDPNYISWQKGSDYISQLIYNQELLESADLNFLCGKILNENYRLLISVDGNCTTTDETLQFFYLAIGITDEETKGIWYRDNTYGIDWYTQSGNAEKYIRTPSHDFCMRRSTDDAGNYYNQIIVDNVEYKKVANGVNVVVYDTVTETVVDSFGFDMDNEYKVVR